MSTLQRTVYYLEYLLFRGIAFCINGLSLDSADRFAVFCGNLLFFILRERRQIALENLKASFGSQKKTEELESIARTSMQNLVRIAYEFIRIPRIVKNWRQYIQVTHADYAWEGLRQGKGIVFIISHFGNWEYMALAGAGIGLPLHTVARTVKNPFVYAYIKKLRSLIGMALIDKGGAVRETIKCLKNNQTVAMLIDQHERQGAVWVDFFGRKAATTSLPAMLALRYNACVIPVFMYRQKFAHFVMEFGAPFSLIHTGNFETDVYANTQQYIFRIEEEVRKRPGDWLWMHRRWRPVPKPACEVKTDLS